MREIDSAALEAVARALGVGNPATATRDVTFDDATLQQAFDVGPLVRYRAARQVGPPSAGGWFVYTIELTQNGGGVANGGGGIQANVDGVEREDTVWIYGISLYLTASAGFADLDDANISFDFPAEVQEGPGNFQGFAMFLAGASSEDLSANTAFYGSRAIINQFPFPFIAGSSYDTSITNGGVGNMTAEFMLLCRALPAGIPPGIV